MKKMLEPTFADAVTAIERATDLPPLKRSHWICSLRRIGAAMGKPLEIIAARWTAARFAVARLHPATVGCNAKTLSNHKSNVRAALLWFGKENIVPARGTPLNQKWAALQSRLDDRQSRAALSALMRYCSGRQIAPAAVDEAVIDGFMQYRAETTALKTGDPARRAVARAWNACVGRYPEWPQQKVVEPPVKPLAGPAWDSFPPGLRADIERYLAGLTKVRRRANGKRIRPCKTSTIRLRRAELVAFARMAVREGKDIATLASLSALLEPTVAEGVLDAYWRNDGDRPRIYTIELSSRIVGIARETGCVDEAGLDCLKNIRATLEGHRERGLTEKNLGVIRQVLSGNVWGRVLNLPVALMEQARAVRGHAPVKAAVTAEIAVAVAILSVAPIRLGNLIRMRLDENIIRPGGLQSPYWLVFPSEDVKNRVRLEFMLDEHLTALIDEYIHDFRTSLLRGSNDLWLFPGEAGGCKDSRTLSGQITKRIEKATGLRMTVHQFRHAAAAILLKHRPGEYELVRQLLAHRNVQTTIQFYCGLETAQANAIFGDIVRKQMNFEPEQREGIS